MTKQQRSTARGLARRVFWPVRRVIAPGALEVPGVAAEVEKLRAALADCRSRAEHAEGRVDELERRLGEVERRLGEVHEEFKADLREAWRLNIRVAELTDVVTELVLPLHDRELDAEALRALRPETR